MENYPRPEDSNRLPDLFIIGAAKSGTSTLSSIMAQHPFIQLGKDKEVGFFSRYFDKGFDWYSANFAQVNHTQLCVDASTSYTRLPQCSNVAERIRYYCPNAKLIYLMRHPVDRAYSHFVHRFTKELHRGEYFDITFEEHILKDPMCIDSSNYKLQIQEYLKYFPRNQLLLLFTHELRQDEAQVLRKVCTFLELEYNEQYYAHASSGRNITSNFIESRVKVKNTDRIKAFPGIRKILPYVPQSMKARGYNIFRQLGFGDDIAKGLTAAPMLLETRKALIDEFQASNDWVAKQASIDLTLWNK